MCSTKKSLPCYFLICFPCFFHLLFDFIVLYCIGSFVPDSPSFPHAPPVFWFGCVSARATATATTAAGGRRGRGGRWGRGGRRCYGSAGVGGTGSFLYRIGRMYSFFFLVYTCVNRSRSASSAYYSIHVICCPALVCHNRRTGFMGARFALVIRSHSFALSTSCCCVVPSFLCFVT